MKTLTVTPDELYANLERRAAAKGVTVTEEVVELVTQNGGGDDTRIAGAKARMEELFRSVKGFRVEPKIPREELHERGSFR